MVTRGRMTILSPAAAPTTSLRRRLPFIQIQRKLAPFSPGNGRKILAIVILSVAGSLAEAAALIVVARSALSIAGGGADVDIGAGIVLSTSTALAAALAALLFKLGLVSANAWLTARLSARTVRTGRSVLLSSYFRADWATQSNERLGDLQDYLASTVGALNGVNSSFVSTLNALISFAVVIGAAIAVNPLAAIGCAVASSLLLLLLRPLSRITRRLSLQQHLASKDLAAEVTETVRTAQEVRVYGVDRQVLAGLRATEGRISGALEQANFTSLIAPQVYQTLALAFLVLAVGAVGLAGGGEISSLGAAVLLLLRGLGYGQQLQTATQSLSNSLPFLDALHARKHLYDSNVDPPGAVTIGQVGTISLDDVNFHYRPNEPVLKNVTVTIDAHEAVGIVGPSGSGKSTLLQLVLRLRTPSSGRITIEGEDLWDITARSWAERVAFVPQEARLLNTTVRANIAFHRDLDEEAIKHAARAAHIHDDITSWPDGYETQVGESGNRVSGGQRQRLAIARALAGRPDLLVLDEPTSALDLLSEAKLQETLAGLAGRVGLVIVAHRLSTVRHCHRILVLKDGSVEGFDTHDALLATSPFYREAVTLSMIDGGGEATTVREA